MVVELTTGAVEAILTSPSEEHPQKPVFQVIAIKKMQNNQTGGTDRFRLFLSDGKHMHTSAMLATQLNDKIANKDIEVKAIIRLDKYICNAVQSRKVLILLATTTLHHADEVPGKIGDPKPFSDPAAAHKEQAVNGTGHQPQQKSANFGSNQQPQQRQPLQQQQQQPLSRGNTFGLSNSSAQRGSYGVGSGAFASHQPAARGGQTGRAVYPISSLTPYQNRWTIRARVTSKGAIKNWSNSRGEGRLFSMEIIDDSGEIRATGFNDVIDKYYDMLQVDKMYYISKGSLKTANKQYSSLKNDYEMTINNDTIIEECHDGGDLPEIKYNFTKIAELENVNKDSVVDILAIVANVGDVSEITTRATNRQVSKRDIMLVDETEKSVSATLWGDEAEKFEEHVGKNPVLAIRGVKVSDFGGRSLSILRSSTISVNPHIDQVFKLRGWFDNKGKDSTNITSLSGQRNDFGGSTPYKTFGQVKVEQLGMGDKPDYFNTKGTIVFFKKENCLYKACPSAECNKKVIEDGDSYRCEKCNRTYPNFKYRLILPTNVADFSGNQWMTCFQESGEALLGKKADEIGRLRDTDEQAFEQMFTDANFKTYTFKIRAKMETYNDETRLKCSCMSATPLDFKQESNRLIKEINKLMQM